MTQPVIEEATTSPAVPAASTASPRRIAVVGSVGSGKTTLARRLARALDLPHIELDNFYWQQNWTVCPEDEFRRQAEQALAGDAWVVDGDQAATRDWIWQRADMVVWLDLPTPVVVGRVLRRTAIRLLRRPELWNGNRGERLGNVLDRRTLVLPLIRRHRAKRRQYPSLLSRPAYRHLWVIRLRSAGEVERWLGEIGEKQQSRTVVQVADYGSPYAGNFIASLRALEHCLQQEGARQVYIFPGRAAQREWFQSLVHGGARVYLLAETFGPLRQTLALRRILRRERASLVHVHFARYDLPAWLAAVSGSMTGRKAALLWHEHGGSEPEAPSVARRLKDLIKLRLLARRARYVPCSDALGTELLERGLAPDRSVVIPNGIDAARVARPRTARVETRGFWGLAPKEIAVLAFGWDPHRKGVDVMLAAMAEAVEQEPRLRLVLVGREPMRHFIRARFGDDVPAWLHPVAPVEEVADLYAAADLFLTASRAEGLPYSLAEAMAAGLPVIATDIGGHARFRDAPAIDFVPVEDAAALAATLVRRADQSRGENVAFARQHFSLDAWTDAILRLYEEALNTRRRKSPCT